MEGKRRPWTGFSLDSWRIVAFPRTEQTGRSQQSSVECSRIFPRLFGALSHSTPGVAPALQGVCPRGDEPIANLTGELHRFRRVSGNVDRHGSASIHEFLVLVEEANHAPRFSILILNFSSA